MSADRALPALARSQERNLHPATNTDRAAQPRRPLHCGAQARRERSRIADMYREVVVVATERGSNRCNQNRQGTSGQYRDAVILSRETLLPGFRSPCCRSC